MSLVAAAAPFTLRGRVVLGRCPSSLEWWWACGEPLPLTRRTRCSDTIYDVARGDPVERLEAHSRHLPEVFRPGSDRCLPSRFGAAWGSGRVALGAGAYIVRQGTLGPIAARWPPRYSLPGSR